MFWFVVVRIRRVGNYIEAKLVLPAPTEATNLADIAKSMAASTNSEFGPKTLFCVSVENI